MSFVALGIVTIAVNVPSILWYGIPQLRLAGADRERRALPLYLMARSVAFIVTAVVALLVARPAFLCGVAVAAMLAQLLDIGVGAYRKRLVDIVLPAVGVVALALLIAWACLES